MNNINMFINTQIENSGPLAKTGDWALSPVRYFFHGRTVRIIHKDQETNIHHVTSFKGNGTHTSKTNSELKASARSILKTLGMIILFAPGLIFGTIAKSFAYLTHHTRENHSLTKKHFTPKTLTLGSETNRLDLNGIKQELKAESEKPLHQKVDNIVIYGDNVVFDSDPGFVWMNPKKVVMVGAKLNPKNKLEIIPPVRKKGFYPSTKWEGSTAVIENKVYTFLKQIKVHSVAEALKHVTKKHHAVFQVTEELEN